MIFRPRVPALLAMEGWHTIETPSKVPVEPYKVKISCRFNDILRCSRFPEGKPKHFESCFNKWGLHREQPERYCSDPSWAIAYVPDKHGNFLGRSFVHWLGGGRIEVGRVYGNRLSTDDLIQLIKMIRLYYIDDIDVVPAAADTYLPEVAQ